MSLSQNSQQAGSTDHDDHRNRSPGSPQDSDTGTRHALAHNKIFLFPLQETPTQPPAKDKSMLNKEILYSSTLTKVDTPQGTQGTCV